MRTFAGFLLACVGLFLLVPYAQTQTAKGIVAGTVKDPANSALTGARVELLPIGVKVVTDDQGKFRIPEVAAGEYTLSTSYVGFAVSNKPVSLEAGKTVNMDEASGLNLSNEVFGFYQGSGIYPIQREFYKPTVSFGMRWTSSAE